MIQDLISEEKKLRKIRKFQESCDHLNSLMCTHCHLFIDLQCFHRHIDYLEKILKKNEIPFDSLQILRGDIKEKHICEDSDMFQLQTTREQN